MANYVSGNIISQSYVHVDPKWLSNVSNEEKEKRVNEIKEEITRFAKSRIPFFIGNEITIDVEFTDGSIKAKITSYGAILSFLGGLTFAYPQFSESVRTMAKDVHDLGNYINSELLFQTEAKYKSERKSVESRLGVFGTIDRVNGKLNELIRTTSMKDRNPSIVYKDLLNLHDEMLSALDKISRNAIDDSDGKTAATMWIEGVSSISLGRLQFKIQNQTDEAIYKQLLDERDAIIANLKKSL